jgi:uncharacterized membrane protein (UPF0136 family)
MIDLTRIFYFVFGAFTVLGGVMGYVKAQSMASLVAGGISGLLLIAAAVLLKGNATAGLVLGGVVALALTRHFGPTFISTGKWMPGGVVAILSVVAIVMTILTFIKR